MYCSVSMIHEIGIALNCGQCEKSILTYHMEGIYVLNASCINAS